MLGDFTELILIAPGENPVVSLVVATYDANFEAMSQSNSHRQGETR
jgi:hypothetical protein